MGTAHRSYPLIRRSTTIGLILSIAMVSSFSLSQDWTPPLTEHGYPDLQGTWDIATVTNLERGPQFEGRLSITAEEVATIGIDGERYLDNLRNNRDGRGDDDVGGYDAFWMDPGEQMAMIDGMYRTSIITDPENGRLPWRDGIRATLRTRPAGSGAFDGPETRGAAERCLVGFGSSGGPPMLPVLYNNHSQIVQTRDHVMILAEMNHDARIIPLNAEHDANGFAKWQGDNVGYYEGNTLVVISTNFNLLEAPRGSLRHYFWVSPEATVTERFTRIDENTILYQFEVDDPVVYTQVWRGELPMRAAPGPIYEYACHEGNYALPGILAGARVAEQDAAAGN
jgi:hypothetical protein